MAKFFMELSTYISPYRTDRKRLCGRVDPGDLTENNGNTHIDIYEMHNTKERYKLCVAGDWGLGQCDILIYKIH